ncbi:hypothetical protein GPECTOR_19g247 [Gonium pectorale]|uniref:RRM domain-containing protein n=1 Tax=Gonium pectorale TaxID=33097 RepID=A0A150GJ28_GONPE|nr:hypothetical protein GPECTOR_19g247 [Gonium pectorale]|eukprot:KXZ49796.1 hypothetical protein GPECTOR_19g247 [Gonium pectorale]
MKGLPFKGSKEDIVKFFAGFTLRADQVYLRKHPDGRPNGEAFVVFENSDEARRATQKDRETFSEKYGDRYVRVYPTLDSDIPDMQVAVAAAQQMEHAAQGAGGHAHGAHTDSVVKIKSLPFDATQLDIIHFFESFKLKPNGVQLVVRSDNKPTGEAFVDFETPEEAARSIREKDHKVFSEKFGDRYVRLIQVSRKEMQATLALRFGGEGVLKMKGIPFKATAMDVRKFFSSYKIKQDGVSFIMHADGRPTGMAFIEFETPQEAVRAMEKDRAKFGPEYGERFCMLQLVGRHEMEKVALQRENETTTNKLLNGINVLQAAAFATQAALNNPALQPILMASNQWLNPIYPSMGMVNPAAANPAAAAAALANAQLAQGPAGAPAPVLDPATLTAASQYGAALPQGGLLPGGMNAAALLFQQQQAQAAALQQGAATGGVVDPAGGWLDPAAAAAAAATGNLQLLYQNAAAVGQSDWARAAAASESRLMSGLASTLSPHGVADLAAIKGPAAAHLPVPMAASFAARPLGVAPPPLRPPLLGAALAAIRPDVAHPGVPPAAALAATAAAGMTSAVPVQLSMGMDDGAAAAAVAALAAASGNQVL